MKYLKSYKIFESNKEQLDNIEDIFREVEDLGFGVEVHKNIDGVMMIFIEKFDEEDPSYKPTKEFVDALLHLSSYVIECGFEYSIETHRLSETTIDGSIINILETEEEIMKIVNIKPIHYIKITISYKD